MLKWILTAGWLFGVWRTSKPRQSWWATRVALPAAGLATLGWVWIQVWDRYGYWIWTIGGSSSGSW